MKIRLFSLLVVIGWTNSEFAELEVVGHYDDVGFITVDPHCPMVERNGSLFTTPNWHIAPGSPFQILTDPPQLMTATVSADGTSLLFQFTDVAFLNTTAATGVRLQMPADQLRSVSVLGSHKVQIAPGFTNLIRLTVDNFQAVNHTAATLYATLTSSISSSSRPLILSAAGDATEIAIRTTDAAVELRARGDDSQHSVQIAATSVSGRFHGVGDLLVEGQLGDLEHFGSGTVVTTTSSCSVGYQQNGTGTCTESFAASVAVPELPALSTQQNMATCLDLDTSYATRWAASSFMVGSLMMATTAAWASS